MQGGRFCDYCFNYRSLVKAVIIIHREIHRLSYDKEDGDLKEKEVCFLFIKLLI